MDLTVIKEQPSCFILGVVFFPQNTKKNLSVFLKESIGHRCVTNVNKC